jgi:Domain of unknown function (DUF4267)
MEPHISAKQTTIDSSVSEPLIETSVVEPDMASKTISSLASTTIRTVSMARNFAGGIILFTPQFGAHLFGVPLPSETHIVARLFGVRDLAVGGLLWVAHSRFVTALSRSDSSLIKECGKDLDRMLQLSMVIDSVDVISSIVSIWSGDMGGRAIFWIPCGALILVGLQWLALRLVKL